MSSTVGWSATAIAAAVRDGVVTAERVMADHLDAIAAQEPHLHAWAFLDPELALGSAREVDRQLDRAVAHGAGAGAAAMPLAGVPIGVKDIIDVAGMPTRNGAAVPEAGPATNDASVVASLRAAGATIVGKTVTTEYALFQPGPTVNPHDATRTPGGSSSGSAAAVAAGTLPLAIGTQTAGSVVRPASFCGVVGAKPSFGAVPRDGVTLCSSTLDTVGLLGRTVEDVALGLGIMAEDPDGFVPVDVGDDLRVGFCRTFEWDLLEATTRSAIEVAVARLADHLDVVETPLPDAMQGLAEAQSTVMGVECTVELAEVREQHGELLSDALHAALRFGDARRWAYEAALDHAAAGRRHLDEALAGVDVLLAPAVLGEAPALATTGDPLLCRQWTLLGTPTVAIPGLVGPAGLPVGVQVVAAPGRDAVALGAAARIGASIATSAAASVAASVAPSDAAAGDAPVAGEGPR